MKTAVLLLGFLGAVWAQTNRTGLVFHMIPHSHMDAGWLFTMEEYYLDHVKHILTNVMTALEVGSPELNYGFRPMGIGPSLTRRLPSLRCGGANSPNQLETGFETS